MSPDNKLPAGKDESQGSTSRKNTASRPQEAALKCPRCDSTNTKFCYYNNYNLTQPRHFCKTCRRYWTKGGALRNVPIGGGCRKNKKMKPFQRISGDSKDSSGSSDIGGLKFFQNISPAMDFQLGGLNFPRFHSPSTSLFNQFSSVGNMSNTCGAISSSPYLNLDPSSSSSPPLLGFSTQGFHEMGSLNVHTNLESLSSINQELHWKLQQQRLALLVAGDNQKEISTIPSNNINEPLVQKPQPILFQNLDTTSRQESYGIGTSRNEVGPNENLSTEWFFDNSYATVTPIPVTSRSFATENSGSWSAIQTWSTDLTQYTALP